MVFCTLNPLRWPRNNLDGTGSQCISATVLFSTMAWTLSGAATGTVQAERAAGEDVFCSGGGMHHPRQIYLSPFRLTVLSREAEGNGRLRSGAVVVHSLNLQLVRNKCVRSRDDKLGVVGHGHGRPLAVQVLLPPHDFIVKPWTVGLEARQRLWQEKVQYTRLDMLNVTIRFTVSERKSLLVHVLPG